jgi:UDP-GlcNAc:undecaprenyl-phosphate GlcNAc-1-phosphate transferase
MLLVVKYSRRIKGFKVTTMDFLIIFIAVVVPNLPDHSIQSYQLGQLAVKIVVILFSYEVLIKELRGRFESLVFATLAALILISSRGLSF